MSQRRNTWKNRHAEEEGVKKLSLMEAQCGEEGVERLRRLLTMILGLKNQKSRKPSAVQRCIDVEKCHRVYRRQVYDLGVVEVNEGNF